MRFLIVFMKHLMKEIALNFILSFIFYQEEFQNAYLTIHNNYFSANNEVYYC